MRLLWRGVLIASAAAGLLGCNDIEVCGSTQTRATSDAGVDYRCTTAEDCPRRSGVSVCVTDVSPQFDCVKCEETYCVDVEPKECK
ncbi:hypothetical protein [Hyalangium rubrum]|uniref:Lipoprotein n=1 Tax=Hyalangium rubrum TaxID=3103134 RepID=A0ABU5GYA1_9BACT|nr:hypothetical protein [Hyalangium sp. s54d21]MDY7226172.1 hypothetical protein [Hyalangium sp. s54d21]